jgi:2,3-bisphosphoglycerate-independent phosphoglycerate mutase
MNKVIMIILDGFGVGKNYDGNAIGLANMNCYNELLDIYPNTELSTTGENVLTPEDKTIDCEVSHLILGAGKVVPQDITICNENVSSTLIEQNEKLIDLLEYLKETDGNLHLVGMVSDGKVYSDLRYMMHLISHLKNMGVKKLYFHAILMV